MSRLTDAIDSLEVEVPSAPDTALAASDGDLLEAAVAALRASDLAAAALAPFGDDEVEFVGFSSHAVEPFYARGPARLLEPGLRQRLTTATPVEGFDDVLWGHHRGHAIFLAPTLEGARACLALRVGEVLDAARSLGLHGAALARVARGLDSVRDLEAALADDAVESVVAALEAAGAQGGSAPTVAPASAPTTRRPELALVDGLGGAVLVRPAGAPGPLAFVERGGRPHALALGVDSLEALLALVHGLIDLDAPAAEVLARGGVRVEAGRPPEVQGASGTTATLPTR